MISLHSGILDRENRVIEEKNAMASLKRQKKEITGVKELKPKE